MNESKKRNVTTFTKQDVLVKLLLAFNDYPSTYRARSLIDELLSPEQDREVEQK